MQDWVDVIEKNDQRMKLRLKSNKLLDVSLFERFEHDDLCLRCVLNDTASATITYAIQDFLSLDDFLDQYTFKKEEGYTFLENLFTSAVAVNRNKPVLVDPEFIFVSNVGDRFAFVGIPLVIDEWLIQKDVWIEIVKYLINHFKSEHAYEINGFLIKFVESSEFSLPNLILAIKALHDSYYPKKLFHFKRNNSFVLKRPLIPNTIIKECVQEYGHLPQEEKTQLIGSFDEYKAYLSDGTTNYPLIGETVLIGRSMACDIRIESLEISLKHAKLTRVDDRWYIQDLKSKNKTYLNEKLVQRKMRLKDGMVISFSQKQFTFHEK
ncbi:FOG: FHA domain [Faecalitalea cylindroides T2-87]|uniref:FOG: FHA domain n=2 Tax=Faecalitalea cylindroides TaxID=39483 RepID=D4JEK5_9FIRM|nr:FHA domain-containing protein [Faecalitalea cylindroides]MBM6652554.1 FHA domain-containing protein [Faecalitalea cylindroides]CBK88627.1 FOG: FHA domain [Faecalitalea cylindroides T2-87]